MQQYEADKLIADSISTAKEHLSLNSLDTAEMIVNQVLRCSSSNPEALQILGLVYHRRGNYKEAISTFDEALRVSADNAENFNNRALCLSCIGEIDRAIDDLKQAIRLNPYSHVFHNNIALQYRQAGDAVNSEKSFSQSLELSRQPQTLCNLGGLYGEEKRFSEAMKCFEDSLEIDPDTHYAHEGIAYTAHLMGDHRRGWEEYEHRFKFFPQLLLYAIRYNPDKRWKRGDDLTGKKLVIYCEQGLGDTINFARFIPIVKQRFQCHITLHCPETLEGLLRSSKLSIDEFHSKSLVFEDHVPDHDIHTSLMSLPYLLNIDVPTPGDAYISTTLHATMPDDGTKKIGICWAGSPIHANDSRRSCALKLFERIYRLEGVSLFSLQENTSPRAYRFHPEPIDLAAGCQDWVMTDCRPWMKDFESTAAIINELDCVISVDTAILHLAGALGKKTYGLIAYNPDWRWGVEGDKTHWYRNMTLMRQPSPGDWESVFEKLAGELGS